MKLSVIVPCLNGAETIAVQMEALANQKWSEPWEVIVSDNGSSDNSLEIVRTYRDRIANLRIVDASARRGQPFALNTGADAAFGESLAFCDADDEVAPGWVAAIGNALLRQDFVACRMDLEKLNQHWIVKSRRNPQDNGVQEYPSYLRHAGGGTLGVKRWLYNAVGGFDDTFPLLHDTDFCWKIQMKGIKLHFVPDAIIHVRLRDNLIGIYRQAQGYGEYNVKLCHKYFEYGMPKPSLRNGISAWLYLVRHLMKIRDRGTSPISCGRSGTGRDDSWRASNTAFLRYERRKKIVCTAGGLFFLRKTKEIAGSVPACVAGTITGVSTSQKAAALTFDDGPHPVFTPLLLDILKRHDARATFFMLGKAAEKYPGLVKLAAEGGHAIGVHSWDHPSFPSIPGRQRRAQIRACVKAVAPYGCGLFRPPYAHQTPWSRIDALLLGQKVIAYNAHALDWEIHDSSWTAERLKRSVKPGSIVLLHDSLWTVLIPGAEDRLPMLKGLDAYLEEAGKKLRFVTVPELLKLGSPTKKNWYVRNHDDW